LAFCLSQIFFLTMFSLCVALLFMVVGVCSAKSSKILPLSEQSVGIEGQWLIRLKEDASPAALETLEQSFLSIQSQKVDTIKVNIGPRYKLLIVKNCDKKFLQAAVENPDVLYIEQDAVVTALQSCSMQDNDVPWGLSRVSHDDPDHNDEFMHDPAWGVSAYGYVIDTGIYIAHSDFSGRGSYGANFINPGQAPNDGHGHGTHVGSTMVGKTYGISRKTAIVAVKVLSDGGSGSWSGVIQGIQWVTDRHRGGTKPSVANMSLGGGKNQAVNDAVDASSEEGVVHVVAAGNSNNDACTLSPASAPSAITVGATTISQTPVKDTRSSFSSYGSCMKIWAPGQDVKGAWIGSPTATRTISGTSMASPHVAGVALKYVAENPSATPEDVLAYLQTTGQEDLVDMKCTNSACNASPNLFLHVDCSEKK
jgi:hypothetical protein